MKNLFLASLVVLSGASFLSSSGKIDFNISLVLSTVVLGTIILVNRISKRN